MHVLRMTLYAQKYQATASLQPTECAIADCMWMDIIHGLCNPPLASDMRERIKNGER